MRHNNILPNGHFHKDWQRRVKTWFDQAPQKKVRRLNRIKKAAKLAPRPIDKLRPAVRCPTVKYNTKLRLGRGFTLEELKAAGISRKVALTVGITVDHRRKNRSVESLEQNVQRLKEYKAKLVVFPKKANKPKKGDATAAELAAVSQFKGTILPISNKEVAVSTATLKGEQKTSAYATLRIARANKKLKGIREKILKQKAEEEKAKK